MSDGTNGGEKGRSDEGPSAATEGKAPARRLQAGDRCDVEITGLLPSGEGVAGRMRVAGAFPDESVVARVEHIGKHATFATALEVHRGRMGRRPPPCPQHVEMGGRCTGCALMSLEESDQREVLRDMLASAHGLTVDAVEESPKARGYRYSAKRIVFGGPGKLRLGSFVRGSHKPADMEGCLVDHPRVTAAADSVAYHGRDLGLGAHDGKRGRTGLRSVWIRTDGTRVLVTLVTSDGSPDGHNALMQLASRLDEVDGVFWSLAEGEGNNLRGTPAEKLRGIDTIEVAGVPIGPLGFLQPNPPMVARIHQFLCEGVEGRVWDLYAGSGGTTRRLEGQGATVTPVESHPESAAALGVPAQTTLAFLQTQEPDAADVVIANPPRKGLGAEVCAELVRLGPPELRIMACGPAGLARDLEALSSRYALTSLRAFDTLPQTPHVEVVARLRLV